MQSVKLHALIPLLAMSIVASTAGYAAEAKPESKSKNVAVVNGIGIPQSRLDFVAKSQLAQSQGQQQQGQPPIQDTPEFRENLREILITREILYQEAIKRKLDRNPDYQTQLDLAKQQIILAVLVEDMSKKLNPTEADLRKEYERVKTERGADMGKQYKSRHILLKDEAVAKQIIADLDAGGDFAAMAKEKSEDTGTRDAGGELDWSEAEGYVQPFGEAIKALKKGERTKEAVKTNFGFHIIELQDVRPITFPEFDQVKPQIQQQLATKLRDDFIADLRTKAKIQKIDVK